LQKWKSLRNQVVASIARRIVVISGWDGFLLPIQTREVARIFDRMNRTGARGWRAIRFQFLSFVRRVPNGIVLDVKGRFIF
jgi:hypothetical protein